MIAVYLAGPITKPDPKTNAIIAIQTADQLIDLGFVPFVPQLSVFQQEYGNPRDTGDYGAGYEVWMKMDFEWIRRCDCLFRIEGYSLGADREVAFAFSLGKPVFTSVAKLAEFYAPKS